jgi:hypothetical protein
MQDLMEEANDIQEALGRTYGLPDDVDEADLEAGMTPDRVSPFSVQRSRQ